MADDSSIAELVAELVSRLQNVKLGPGVVGRNSSIAWVALLIDLACIIAAIFLRSIWLAGTALAAGTLVGILIPFLNVHFGKKNPGAALLEGAEFLTYQQVELASKGVPAIQPSAPMPQPPSLPPKEPEKER
jgi:hypothetical protein